MAESAKKSFWRRDATAGYVLVVAAAASFLLQNGPLAHAFHVLIDTPLAHAQFGSKPIEFNLHLLINDALMAIFFLYVGLELKRETVEGPFRNPKTAALPMIAALGGMAAPAAIYVAINANADPAFMRGWAIPTATDIAFAIGVLALLGKRIPAGLRLFLLALAIVDDLGAILVIAIFYSTSLVGWALGGAGACLIVMMALNRFRVHALWPYLLLAVPLWAFMLVSGVHATIAGVVTAIAIPMRGANGESPLVALEHALKPWVQLAIMPLFALANAGVSLAGVTLQTFLHPVALGSALGLVLGKPIGICLSTWIAAAALKRPTPGDPIHMIGLSLVAGIGFTMSLFIGTLAFGDGDLAAPVRLGVLGGSIVAAVLGLLTLALATRGSGEDASLSQDEDIAEARDVLDKD